MATIRLVIRQYSGVASRTSELWRRDIDSAPVVGKGSRLNKLNKLISEEVLRELAYICRLRRWLLHLHVKHFRFVRPFS